MLAACNTHVKSEDPYVVAFRAIRPSVALVTVKNNKGEEYGTATVLGNSPQGALLLTDAHVVAHATRISVQIGARNLGNARLVASDISHDAALIRMPHVALPAVVLGDSSLLEPGAQVAIAGYPVPDAFTDEHLGVAVSLYTGRVASVRENMLELDAAVIPGDSGGPVFDPTDGRVVALGEARFDDERAIGLATPINVIKPFIRPYLAADSVKFSL